MRLAEWWQTFIVRTTSFSIQPLHSITTYFVNTAIHIYKKASENPEYAEKDVILA